MIKELIQYPTPLSIKFATDVRNFNEELFALIGNLTETIKANNLVALSAFQIGNYYNVIVVKDENGEFIELINPRLISHSDKSTAIENTSYYPGFSAEISRYENISIVYQDRNGDDKAMKFSGDMARVVQRKLDYTFGATFIQKMSPEERERFETKLEFGVDIGVAEYCPTTFKRDYILKVINISMLIMLVMLIASFFIDESLWTYQLYASFAVLLTNVIYFFYAQYEGKIYTSCSSCQIGNIIGTTLVSLTKLSAIMIASYFLI